MTKGYIAIDLTKLQLQLPRFFATFTSSSNQADTARAEQIPIKKNIDKTQLSRKSN